MSAIEELMQQISEKTVSQEEFGKLKELVEKREKDLGDLDKQRDAKLKEQLGELEVKLKADLASVTEGIAKSFKHEAPAPTEKFKSFGEYILAVKKNDAEKLKDLTEGTGSQGGYLVPEQYRNELMQLSLEQSFVRSNGAMVIPMTSSVLRMPAVNMSSNATGSLFGGMSVLWEGEGATLTESQPAFDRVELRPKKMTIYVEDTAELEEDSIFSMSAILSRMFADAIAFEEDYNFLHGNDSGRTLGVLNAPALVTVSRTTASTVGAIDLFNMYSRFRGNYSRAVWMVNQTVLPQILNTTDGTNHIFTPSLTAGVPMSLLGRPMIVTEKASALGTEGDVMLVDWGHYLVGDRGGLRIDRSEHFKFQNDMMCYRAIRRVDGRPWLKSAITPRKGASTLSPFVALST